MADNVTIKNASGATVTVGTDEVTIGGVPVQVQRVLVYEGTFAYAAGDTAETVDVPTGARIKRVSVVAGAAPATLTILGGETIPIPAGASFDEIVPGDAIATAGANEIVVGGDVDAYYVSWVA